MDSTHVRPALPSIHALAMEGYKREEADYQPNNRLSEMPPSTIGTPVKSTPAYHYPSGPPPPYSNLPPPAQPATLNTPSHGPHNAPQTTEEKEMSKPQPKQSLPSLHEALGEQPPASYAPSESTYSTASQAPPPASIAASPSLSGRSSLGMDPPATHFSQPTSYHGSYSHYSSNKEPYAPSRYDSEQSQRRAYNPTEPSSYHSPAPPSHNSMHSPLPRSRPPPGPPAREPVSAYDSQIQPSASAAASSRGFAYGYAPYPPQFAHPSTTSASSAAIYQPSITQPPPGQAVPYWRADPATAGHEPGLTSAAPYGESVKRHLDMYDFETALNEIADNSTVALDFSRQYGARLHQMSRSGPTPGSLPAITEVDELINKSRHTMDALSRLRDVLVAQQAAYNQQAQEQRFKNEVDGRRNDSVVHQAEDAKGGFAGSDAKKRRGRAAAPGRCHSCQRAETPEWRRGPDGARTLCNACGLHYAKLTRKAGANKGSAGGSLSQQKTHDDDEGAEI